ncbi:MAG: hypothetical protein ACR2NU_10760, partial [Aeoliella sp.]
MPLTTRRQLELLRELQLLANNRHEAEERITQEFREGTEQAAAQYEQSVDLAEQTYQQATESIEKTHTATAGQLQTDYEQARDSAQEEYRGVREEIASKYESTVKQTKETKKQAAWQALAVFDAAKNNPREELEATQQDLARQQEELEQLKQDAQTILRMRRLWRNGLDADSGAANDDTQPRVRQSLTPDEAKANLREKVDAARTEVERLHQHRGSKLLEGGMPIGLLLVVWLLLLVPFVIALGLPNWPMWLGGSLVGAALVGGIGGWMLWRRASAWSAESYRQISDRIAAARSQIDLTAIIARDKSRIDAQQLIETRDADLVAADAASATALGDIESWKAENSAASGQTFPTRLTNLRDSFDRDTAAEEKKFRTDLAAVTEKHETDLRDAEATRQETLAALNKTHDREETGMRDAWFAGFARFQASLADMRSECERLFPDWNVTDYATWPKPTEVTEAIQFGTATLELAKVKHALSSSPELRPEQTELE